VISNIQCGDVIRFDGVLYSSKLWVVYTVHTIYTPVLCDPPRGKPRGFFRRKTF